MKLLVLTTIHDAKFVSEDAKEYRNPCFKEIENFQRNYVHRYQDIVSFFVKANPEQKELYVLEKDTLSIRCGVNRQGELKKKMLLAFEYFLSEDSPCKDWDFLLRGTTTCFKNLPVILKLCDKEKLYLGVRSEWNNIPYIRGDCVLMSKDVVKVIVEKKEDSNVETDDVFYGDVCSKNGIETKHHGQCLSFGDYHPWFSPFQAVEYLDDNFCSARIFCKNREDDLKYHIEMFKKFLRFKVENFLNIGEINIYSKNCLNFISKLKEATEILKNFSCFSLEEKENFLKEEKEEKKENKLKIFLDFLFFKKSLLVTFFSSFSENLEKQKLEKEDLLNFAKVMKQIRSVETYRILYMCKDTEFDLDFSMFNIDKVCIGENLVESYQAFHKVKF